MHLTHFKVRQVVVLKRFSEDRWKAKSMPITCVINILVMQRFRVVYHGMSHKSPVFSQYKINATYAQHTMGSLGVISSNIQELSCNLIGCIYYRMV